MNEGPNGPGVQLLQQVTFAPPQRTSFVTLQPLIAPWGLSGALPPQLTKLLQRRWECGSVVKFLPNIQRPRMDCKTKQHPPEDPLFLTSLRIHFQAESIYLPS